MCRNGDDAAIPGREWSLPKGCQRHEKCCSVTNKDRDEEKGGTNSLISNELFRTGLNPDTVPAPITRTAHQLSYTVYFILSSWGSLIPFCQTVQKPGQYLDEVLSYCCQM